MRLFSDLVELASRASRRQILLVVLIVGVALSVRVLTLQFMRAHLHDPGWFQVGTYAQFDRQARAIIEGRQHLFWIDDPTRTDLVQYPPAYPLMLAVIYSVTANWSVYSAQIVQWTADLVLSPLLIVGITVTAFGWRAGAAAGFVTGVLPLFAMYGAYPSADMPTTWFVLAGNWLLLLGAKRNSI